MTLYPHPQFILAGPAREEELARMRGPWPLGQVLPVKRNMTDGESYAGKLQQAGLQLGHIRREEMETPVVRHSFGGGEPLIYPSLEAMVDDGWRGD